MMERIAAEVLTHGDDAVARVPGRRFGRRFPGVLVQRLSARPPQRRGRGGGRVRAEPPG
ncbi:DUF6959 family protein [Streptomyces actuosus]|uniref:DUF6959 family protein n=1 Tax=Streptomyces actuosus TaxID=1885 RepID=UPI003F688CBB